VKSPRDDYRQRGKKTQLKLNTNEDNKSENSRTDACSNNHLNVP